MTDMPQKIIGGVFIVIIGLLVFTSNAPVFQDYEINIDNNWTDYGTLSANMLTDGDVIYPDSGFTGNWTGLVNEETDSQVIFARGEADMRDGSGFIEIRLYENPPTVQSSPNITLRETLDSGSYNILFQQENISRYDFFVPRISMTEVQNTDNKRPSVESFNLGYSALETTAIDPRKPLTQIIGLLAVFLGVLMILLSMTDR